MAACWGESEFRFVFVNLCGRRRSAMRGLEAGAGRVALCGLCVYVVLCYCVEAEMERGTLVETM